MGKSDQPNDGRDRPTDELNLNRNCICELPDEIMNPEYADDLDNFPFPDTNGMYDPGYTTYDSKDPLLNGDVGFDPLRFVGPLKQDPYSEMASIPFTFPENSFPDDSQNDSTPFQIIRTMSTPISLENSNSRNEEMEYLRFSNDSSRLKRNKLFEPISESMFEKHRKVSEPYDPDSVIVNSSSYNGVNETPYFIHTQTMKNGNSPQKTASTIDPVSLLLPATCFTSEISNSFSHESKDLFPDNLLEPKISLSFSNYNHVKTEVVENIPKKDSQPVLTPNPPQPLHIPSQPPAKVWDRESLSSMFGSTLIGMYNNPEAYAFREPVDVDALNIPDYYEIIKKPIDLGTIMFRLKNGEYNCPWNIIEDVWLMFANAWLYNKRNTKVHKSACKLSSIFAPEADKIMKQNRFCCGNRYTYSPQVLYCFAKDYCVIQYNQEYFQFESKYIYCKTCFNEIKGNDIIFNDEETGNPIIFPKSSFTLSKNDTVLLEPYVVCKFCGLKVHKICVMHVESIDGKDYICSDCKIQRKLPILKNNYTSKNLRETSLGRFIQNEVNRLLTNEGFGDNEVIIRVICNVDKYVQVRPKMQERFGNVFSKSFSYRLKAIFGFQMIDGNEICLFGMHTQEYGHNCPEPNRGRVYLSYLDSVHFFRPKHLRTKIYHQILLSYLEYCRNLGFKYCHIWSCPPSEGDDYIFHCHPLDQKLPKHRRLAEWYHRMIEVGISQRILVDSKDMTKLFTSEVNEIAPNLPYFDGDYWQNCIEDCIQDVENEQKNLNVKKTAESKGSVKRAKSSKHRTSLSKKPQVNLEPLNLNQRLINLMEKFKEVFFVLELRDPNPDFRFDNDPIIPSELMEGRSCFLTTARENHWEFSSLRRAQYSTKAMLYVVHQQMFNVTGFSCNNCGVYLTQGYQCQFCTDFDLCINCFSTIGHEHSVELKTYKKITEKLSDIEVCSTADSILKYIDSGSHSTDKNSELESFLATIAHSLNCIPKTGKCELGVVCQDMKMKISHIDKCDMKVKLQCQICRYMFKQLLQHARLCRATTCIIPYCFRLRKIASKERFISHKQTRRRMALMNTQIDNPDPERSAIRTLRTPTTRVTQSSGGLTTQNVVIHQENIDIPRRNDDNNNNTVIVAPSPVTDAIFSRPKSGQNVPYPTYLLSQQQGKSPCNYRGPIPQQTVIVTSPNSLNQQMPISQQINQAPFIIKSFDQAALAQNNQSRMVPVQNLVQPGQIILGDPSVNSLHPQIANTIPINLSLQNNQPSIIPLNNIFTIQQLPPQLTQQLIGQPFNTQVLNISQLQQNANQYNIQNLQFGRHVIFDQNGGIRLQPTKVVDPNSLAFLNQINQNNLSLQQLTALQQAQSPHQIQQMSSLYRVQQPNVINQAVHQQSTGQVQFIGVPQLSGTGVRLQGERITSLGKTQAIPHSSNMPQTNIVFQPGTFIHNNQIYQGLINPQQAVDTSQNMVSLQNAQVNDVSPHDNQTSDSQQIDNYGNVGNVMAAIVGGQNQGIQHVILPAGAGGYVQQQTNRVSNVRNRVIVQQAPGAVLPVTVQSMRQQMLSIGHVNHVNPQQYQLFQQNAGTRMQSMFQVIGNGISPAQNPVPVQNLNFAQGVTYVGQPNMAQNMQMGLHMINNQINMNIPQNIQTPTQPRMNRN